MLGQVSGFLMLVLHECTFTGSCDVPTAKTLPYLRLAMHTLCIDQVPRYLYVALYKGCVAHNNKVIMLHCIDKDC